MRFRSLHLQDIRSYELFETPLSEQVTVIAGPNGSGKTNLLEALYVLSYGSSFRGRDHDLLRHGSPHSVIKTVMIDESERRLTLDEVNEGRVKKEFQVAGSKRQRLSFAQRLPVVLFDPEGLRALSSSPTRRRDFLDGILTRLTPTYGTILHRYERSLLQRNELLKRQSLLLEDTWRDQLFVWDVKVAELAEQVVDARLKLIDRCNGELGQIYSVLSDRTTTIELQYDSFGFPEGGYRQTIFAKLQHNLARDAERGYTSVGPHRDDFVVMINGRPSLEVASRGEMRTIMLAFKILETKLMSAIYETAPLLLLDDVFSELDATRRNKLTEFVRNHQTIITTTDADIVAMDKDYTLIKTAA